METSGETMRIDYDEDLDVLRVALEPWREDAVAVGDSATVVMVEEGSGRVLGFVFEDFLVMVERTLNRTRPETAEGRRKSFEHWRPFVTGLTPAFAMALAPVAKERLSDWLRLVGGASA